MRKWVIKTNQNLGKTETSPGSTKSGPWNKGSPRNRFRHFYFYLILGGAAFLFIILSGLLGRHLQWGVREVPNVHYMDSVGPNFLFRGGLPQIGTPPVFNYEGLIRAIQNAGKKARVRTPSSCYLIDVNFLNIENPQDAQWIAVEQKFFKVHPKLGRIQVWGINGTGLSVNDPALAACRIFLARNLDNWLNDRLAQRVELLRGWLENGPSADQGKNGRLRTKLPIVIYIHCAAGCDRTGEFSGAYYLRYLNKSWEEVNALNRSMCNNRPFDCKNYRAVQWYSLWLNLERGFSLNWWQEFPCSGN
ncbi:MAG TPA: hypothetical protein VHY08_14925 [Bacillota bacterium]|nr:hypothetical protein [Bacillota bacterium]